MTILSRCKHVPRNLSAKQTCFGDFRSLTLCAVWRSTPYYRRHKVLAFWISFYHPPHTYEANYHTGEYNLYHTACDIQKVAVCEAEAHTALSLRFEAHLYFRRKAVAEISASSELCDRVRYGNIIKRKQSNDKVAVLMFAWRMCCSGNDSQVYNRKNLRQFVCYRTVYLEEMTPVVHENNMIVPRWKVMSRWSRTEKDGHVQSCFSVVTEPILTLLSVVHFSGCDKPISFKQAELER